MIVTAAAVLTAVGEEAGEMLDSPAMDNIAAGVYRCYLRRPIAGVIFRLASLPPCVLE